VKVGLNHNAPGNRKPVRIFGFVLCTLLSGLCFPAKAQQSAKLRHIGFLCPARCGQVEHNGFRDDLRELGYMEGRDVIITSRAAESNSERLRGLAAELVGLNVDVIVTASTPAISAAKESTSAIPIVFASGRRPCRFPACC
jgi:putative ABC transport system substrate-binding protein